MSLLERQRFRNYADLLATERVEALPKAALAAAVSPEPFFAASGGTAGFGLGSRRGFWFCAHHEIHRDFRCLRYFRNASSFSPLICPSGSTRPVTRMVRVS
jgi:hypothetical protein